MIQYVEDAPGKTQNRQGWNGQGSDANDPDVFDAVVGKQFLYVVLNNSMHHTQEAGDQRHHQKKNTNREQVRVDVRQHTQDPINTHFNDHAAHHSGNMRWSCGVSMRQPTMQRHESGFDPKSDEEYQKERKRWEGSKKGCQPVKTEFGPCFHKGVKEADHDKNQGHMHLYQIFDTDSDRFFPVGFENHQNKRSNCHRLPRDQKSKTVPEDTNQNH